MERQKGAITVYLTMTFLIVLSLIFGVAESARIQAVRMLFETAVDSGMESFVAAYQQELFEEYDVFFFDGSLGSGHMSQEGITAQLQENMNYLLYPEKGTLLYNTNFYNMQTTAITIEKLAIATDDKGKVFRNQAVDYVKSSMGVAAMESLMDNYNWAMDNLEQSEVFSDTEQETNASLIQLEADKEAIDKENQEAAQSAQNQKNPAADVSTIRSMGILELMYEDTSKISRQSIDTGSLLSNRQINTGTGLESYDDSVVSNVMFQDYLMKKFTHAASAQEVSSESNLQYQIEYMLMGNGSDIENLKGVINRLLLIREGANFAYLLTDAGRVSEAYSAAVLLVGYTGIVPLIEATKYAILLAWAYAESVLDVKILLAGEKVALTKNASNWKTSLANIAEVASMNPKQMSDSSGITYREYLQMMLMVANQDELTMRAMDLMEIHIRNITQNEKFRMDNCILMIETNVRMQTKSVFLSFPFMQAYAGFANKELEATRRKGYDEVR